MSIQHCDSRAISTLRRVLFFFSTTFAVGILSADFAYAQDLAPLEDPVLQNPVQAEPVEPKPIQLNSILSNPGLSETSPANTIQPGSIMPAVGPERLNLNESLVAPAFGMGPATPGTLFGWFSGQRGTLDLADGIITDRPDFTEASSTVGQGILQFEIGYTYTYDNDTANQTIAHSFPETLIRYGMLADWLELRVGSNFGVEDVNNVRNSGAEDLYLGFKLGITPQQGILPEMALIPQLTVPTGAGAFSSGKVLPGLNWIYGWEITDRISTAASTQFNRSVDDVTTNEYLEWAQSWTVAYALTDKWGMYTEWFGLFPEGSDTMQNEHYFNGGFTRAIGNNIQWDVRAGLGLNAAADDYFVGTGLSMRFNNRCRN